MPKNVKELRGFLGLAGYYRKFIWHFGLIAKPLTALLKKDTLFIWTSIHDLAFRALQHALSSAPVLALPDFSQPFHIETDASGNGVGTVLFQNGHPLAFLSKPLSPRNLGLSAYEKEYLAILMAVEQWWHYLLQNEFAIHTDHCSLVHLNEQRLHTPWQQKAFTKLLGLQYRIHYRKGAENGAADALICQLFYWLAMRKDILSFVQSCSVCAQAKPDRARYPGLLQPLPVPKGSWDIITDFVEGLPQSGSAMQFWWLSINSPSLHTLCHYAIPLQPSPWPSCS